MRPPDQPCIFLHPLCLVSDNLTRNKTKPPQDLLPHPQPNSTFALSCLSLKHQKASVCVCWLHTAGGGCSRERSLYWGHGSVLSSRPRLRDRAPRRGNNAPRARSKTEPAAGCACVYVCTCVHGEVGRWKKTFITAAGMVGSSSRKNACKEKKAPVPVAC